MGRLLFYVDNLRPTRIEKQYPRSVRALASESEEGQTVVLYLSLCDVLGPVCVQDGLVLEFHGLEGGGGHGGVGGHAVVVPHCGVHHGGEVGRGGGDGLVVHGGVACVSVLHFVRWPERDQGVHRDRIIRGFVQGLDVLRADDLRGRLGPLLLFGRQHMGWGYLLPARCQHHREHQSHSRPHLSTLAEQLLRSLKTSKSSSVSTKEPAITAKTAEV